MHFNKNFVAFVVAAVLSSALAVPLPSDAINALSTGNVLLSREPVQVMEKRGSAAAVVVVTSSLASTATHTSADILVPAGTVDQSLVPNRNTSQSADQMDR